MNDIIPLEFRILAVLFYTIGSIPMVLVLEHVITSHLNLYDFGIGDYITNHFYRSITIVSISTIITILILWETTKQIHPFIDRSGRDAIDLTLSSIVLVLSCWVVLTWIGRNIEGLDLCFFGFIMLFDICIATAYFFIFAIAIVFSLQGYRFTSFLSYPFI